jgi:hypothetical protein
VVVNDGTVASNLAHAIIEVTQVNNSAPTLDLDGDNSTLPGTSYHTTFTENGTAVAIADTDTLIGDPDIGSTIASATITLTNPQIGDLRAWGFASAIAVVLLACTIVLIYLYNRFFGLDRLWG